MTTTELAGYLAEVTPRLQVAVLRETLARRRPEEQPALVDGLAAALEWSGYDAAARLLRRTYERAVPSACTDAVSDIILPRCHLDDSVPPRSMV